MKRALLAFAAVACLSLAGCKGPCLQLAEKICECEATSTLRDQCKQRASDESSRVTVTVTDEEHCTTLLDGCDCHALDTADGKLACGLARDSSWQ
ncbi:MAG: hypothetical protein HY901_16215 [Deltaproteobacteria bacterium]|nr:hypothetical protein [Deltaproteobacteria bacterium]